MEPVVTPVATVLAAARAAITAVGRFSVPSTTVIAVGSAGCFTEVVVTPVANDLAVPFVSVILTLPATPVASVHLISLSAVATVTLPPDTVTLALTGAEADT